MTDCSSLKSRPTAGYVAAKRITPKNLMASNTFLIDQPCLEKGGEGK